MMATATRIPAFVEVPNHSRFAPADPVLQALESADRRTADDIADDLDLSTRDVVATLNLLAAGENPLVRRRVHGIEDSSIRDGWRALAADWELIR
jgi:hypothetical protein